MSQTRVDACLWGECKIVIMSYDVDLWMPRITDFFVYQIYEDLFLAVKDIICTLCITCLKLLPIYIFYCVVHTKNISVLCLITQRGVNT